jgi:uncharacterized protein (DUF2062 family)
MLFRRRVEQGHWERLRLWVWPRVSWRRSYQYFVKRILRLSGTPHAIALGAAVGAGASFTPFIGFHLLLTFAVAWLLGANMIAGALATTVGNPITFPFIWASTYQIGYFVLDGASRRAPARLEHDLLHRPLSEIVPLIEHMLVGSLPLGILAGGLMYLVVYKAVSAYQATRRRRLADRRGRTQNGPFAAQIGGKT